MSHQIKITVHDDLYQVIVEYAVNHDCSIAFAAQSLASIGAGLTTGRAVRGIPDEWGGKREGAGRVPKPVVWNDIEYESVEAAAAALGIHRTTMFYRINQGYKSDEDLVGWNRKPVVWNGIEYESYEAAAIALGIQPSTMTWRIKQGYTCDDDLAFKRKQ